MKKVLLVEDNPGDALLIREMLKDDCSYEYDILCSNTLSSALDTLAGADFDVILLDLGLLDSQGLDSIVKIKSIKPTIPIIILTGLLNEEISIKSVQLGAQDYLTKDKLNFDMISSSIKYSIERQQLLDKLKQNVDFLKVSESRIRKIIDSYLDSIIIIKEGIICFANPSSEFLFNRNKDELIGTQFGFPVGSEVSSEIEIIHKNKDIRIAEMRVVEMEWEGEIAYLASIQDITERKKVEEIITESRRKYQELYDDAPVGYHELDRKGTIVQVNKTEADMLGYTIQEMLGKPLFDFLDPEEQEAAKKAFRQKINNQTPNIGFERIFICKNGEKIDFYVENRPIVDDKGKITGMRSTLQDITEKKKADEKIKEYSKNLELKVEERTSEVNQALKDTEEGRDRIDSILKSVGEGLLVTDMHNHIVLMNRASEELLNIRFSDVINRPIEYAIDNKTLLDRLKMTIGKDIDDSFDFELMKEGTSTPLFMHARISLIKDKSGVKTGVTISFHDVTIEREVDRMKTEFISTAAHELRTPLTSIRGFSEILLTRENIDIKEQKKFLNYINNQSVRLAKIINDLLDVSRIESGKGYELDKEVVNINDILSNTSGFFRDCSKKHDIEVFIPDRPIQIKVDEEKIEQVMKNIISNAIKYSPSGGLIKVSGEVSDDCYLVTVKDQGLGMTAEQVEKIFDKFYRADASNTAIEGTGLGMSIVKHIIESHGGKIFVKSEPEKGTSVEFTVPLKTK